MESRYRYQTSKACMYFDKTEESVTNAGIVTCAYRGPRSHTVEACRIEENSEPLMVDMMWISYSGVAAKSIGLTRLEFFVRTT
jgi:hypothetical protein